MTSFPSPTSSVSFIAVHSWIYVRSFLLPLGRTAPPPFSKDFCDIVVSGCRIRLRNVMNREAVVTTWRRNTLMILDAGTNSGGFSFGPLGGTEEERGRGVNGINVVRASSTNHSPSDLQTSSSRGIKHPLLVRTIKRQAITWATKLAPRDHLVRCHVRTSSSRAHHPRFNFDPDPAKQSVINQRYTIVYFLVSLVVFLPV